MAPPPCRCVVVNAPDFCRPAKQVIGSWYGSKRVNLDLGGRFHRSHMSLVASQVSVMGASAATRWTKVRQGGWVV